MQIRDVSWFEYSVPLVRPLHFGSTVVDTRQGLVVRVESESGKVGWGEASPLPTFHGWKSLSELAAEAALISKDDIVSLVTDPSVATADSVTPSLAFGLSAALRWIDYAGGSVTTSPRRYYGAKLITASESIAEIRQDLTGIRGVKMKVGGRVRSDAARFRELVQAIPSDVRIRLDANRAWTYTEAVDFISQVDPSRVEFIEEPFNAPSRFAEFSLLTGVCVGADESLQEARGEAAVVDLADQVDVFIIKPTMLGSLRRCHALAREMVRRDKTFVISSAYETGIGTLGILSLVNELSTGTSTATTPAGIGTYGTIAVDLLEDRLDLAGPSFVISNKDWSTEINTDLLRSIE